MLSRQYVLKCHVDDPLQDPCISTRMNAGVTCKCLQMPATYSYSIYIDKRNIYAIDNTYFVLLSAHMFTRTWKCSKQNPTWIYFWIQGCNQKCWVSLNFCFVVWTFWVCSFCTDMHPQPSLQARGTQASCLQASPGSLKTRDRCVWLKLRWNKCRTPGGPAMSAANLNNRQSRKSTCSEFYCDFPGCCWTPNQAGYTHSKILYSSQPLSGQTNHLAGDSTFVHILLPWHLDGYRQGRAQTCRLGTGLCAPFPHPSTSQTPQGSCIHANKNKPKTPICCSKNKEKGLIYHSYFQNQINVWWSCIRESNLEHLMSSVTQQYFCLLHIPSLTDDLWISSSSIKWMLFILIVVFNCFKSVC